MHKNKVEKKHVFNVYVKRVKKPHSLSSLYFAIIVAIVELHFLKRKCMKIICTGGTMIAMLRLIRINANQIE